MDTTFIITFIHTYSNETINKFTVQKKCQFNGHKPWFKALAKEFLEMKWCFYEVYYEKSMKSRQSIQSEYYQLVNDHTMFAILLEYKQKMTP